MLTVSCYAFHPLAARFVRLWKRVQVVSDRLVCVLGLLCCQCGQLPPMSESSSDMDDKEFIDAGLSGEPLVPQHVRIDFTPQPQDEPLETRCIQLWDLIHSQQAIANLMVTPVQEVCPKISPSVPIQKRLPPVASGDRAIQATPALKTIMKLQQQEGAVSAVFQTAMSKQYHR